MLIQIASRVQRNRGESPVNLHSCKSGDLLTKTLKTLDHSRQLNEISIGSDDGINEIDKLRKRFQESVEILENPDVNSIADDYTQRMLVLEKKFQQAIRECDLLKDEVENLKKELSDLSSSLNAEKGEIIKQLREEGEKLS
ncbi:Similar to TMF1: TATA element modulatory factor (Homo sapiens) [Cotesia congregata]|uniref:Similar to TMF1: TATA element modulatory factor (Homo sapiens) n=1 Tax=Cotesia congregata TaxID=51543 RepID=A0A8J2HCA0_COTCN|nr:Similar to TMF1: TATA element modulatory factor (Homo sapiens) [Cotesia congregata]